MGGRTDICECVCQCVLVYVFVRVLLYEKKYIPNTHIFNEEIGCTSLRGKYSEVEINNFCVCLCVCVS